MIGRVRDRMAAGALAVAAIASTGMAQVVAECDWRAQADAIAEPWEKNTRTFADGAIRIAVSDTGEPACCSVSLVVLAPDAVLGRNCFLVRAEDEARGWYGIDLDGVEASYDAARGLLLSVPVDYAHPLGGPDPERARAIDVRINQAEGTVNLE